MALINKYIGSGLNLDGTSYNIKGRSFNPELNIASWGTSSIIGNISNGGNISLSGFQFGHEVIVALGKWDDESTHYIEFRKGSQSLFFYSFGASTEMYAYIGIDFEEIMSNGTDYYVDFGAYSQGTSYGGITYIGPNSFSYNVIIGNIGQQIEIDYTTDFWATSTLITGTITSRTGSYIYEYSGPSIPSNVTGIIVTPITKIVQGTLNYQITNFPTIVGPVESGKIWVEGSNLCFTDAVKGDTGYKHIIKNNGLIYSTGKTPGMFRVDSSSIGALGYIDEYGNERKTHLGDRYGSPGNNEPEMTGLTPGMIRVSTPEGNYGYLTFIGPNGRRYRIMNGDV